MKSDIEIAESVTLQPIGEIARALDITEYETYGRYKAKVAPKKTRRGKLILVTAINPTAAGEGKTTISIGLADGMRRIGKNAVLALREPSLGPVFGVKGGAAGGGYAQIAPMDDINLHFTGDLHAITAANNLLSAMIDNHIYFGNALGLKKITWHRCLDCNDRALRNVVVGLGWNCVREDSFDITAASEVMAALCLSADAADLKARLGDIIVGYNGSGDPVTARDLKADEAMAILLKDAVRPNLVQTLEHTPAFVHGGPFANIAHGCNSVIATETALSYGDYVVTEAGFGADLGAEKFLDIKCRVAGLNPAAVVVVATARALKNGGGVPKDRLNEENVAAVERGLPNLVKHVENIRDVFGLDCVVAINRFYSDTEAELAAIRAAMDKLGVKAVDAACFSKGGAGAEALARTVTDIADRSDKRLTYAYPSDMPLPDKIRAVAQKVYGAADVKFLPAAVKSLAALEDTPAAGQPVCIAKTQYSLSDNPALLGRPEGFTLTVRDVVYRAGARFTVALAGDILLMPGLPVVPNAEKMTISPDGVIRGLF